MSDRGQALRSAARHRARDAAYEDGDLESPFEAPVYEDDVPEIAGTSRFRRAVHGLATLISLTVIGFGGYWGYKQIMRDVHGIPVVRALEGPLRVAPEEPGGMIAANAGLSVNAVQAAGTASEPEESLTLAPSTAGLSEDDLPVAELPEPAESGDLVPGAEAEETELLAETDADAPIPQAAEPEVVASAAPPVQDGVEPQPDEASADAALEDPIARAIAMATASDDTAELAADEAALAQADAAVAETADLGGVQLSPRPLRRPGSQPETILREAGTTGAASASEQPASALGMAAPVPVGTRMVQLGAFDTADEARVAWESISARFEGVMAGKTQVISEVESGERKFWRLRATGFADLADARRFCAALVAERTDCIPVIAR